eukprot:gene12651-19595_t
MFVTDGIKDLVGWVLIINCFTGLIAFNSISDLLRRYEEQCHEYLDANNTKAEFESWKDTQKHTGGRMQASNKIRDMAL